MLTVSRRTLLRSAVGAVAAGSLLRSPAVLAQAAPLKLKFGNDLPVMHSVNVRLKEAIEAIGRRDQRQGHDQPLPEQSARQRHRHDDPAALGRAGARHDARHP